MTHTVRRQRESTMKTRTYLAAVASALEVILLGEPALSLLTGRSIVSASRTRERDRNLKQTSRALTLRRLAQIAGNHRGAATFGGCIRER